MKFNRENTWYASLIIQYWIKNMIRVLLLKPSNYIAEMITLESKNTHCAN